MHIITDQIPLRLGTFCQLDAYYTELEQQDSSIADTSSPYPNAVLSGTLFDYSTVPYPQASDFLQAWIAGSAPP